MKCPACWAEKAYVRKVKGYKGTLLKCLFIVPLRCHHCYHEFSVPWLMTIGKRTDPPTLRVASTPAPRATVPHARRSQPVRVDARSQRDDRAEAA